MKLLHILILILFFNFYLLSQENDSNIQFTWGVLHLNEIGKTKLLDLNSDVKLKKNDYFKFYLHPNDNTYLYLFYLSSEGELTILFPKMVLFDKNAWGFKSNIYIPENKDEWFKFNLKDSKTADIVYLLASSKRIKELDVLIEEFSNYQKKKSIIKINNTKDQIIQKIKLKIKEISQFLSYSIKPISIAGGTRSVPLEGYCQEISAKDFYARVFEIKY